MVFIYRGCIYGEVDYTQLLTVLFFERDAEP